MLVRIYVEKGDQTMTVTARPTMTTRAVKRGVCGYFDGRGEREIELFDQGRRLVDHETLADGGVREGAVLAVRFRREGAFGPEKMFRLRGLGGALAGDSARPRAAVARASRTVDQIRRLLDFDATRAVPQLVMEGLPFVIPCHPAVMVDPRFAQVIMKVAHLDMQAAGPTGDTEVPVSVLHAGRRACLPFESVTMTLKEFVDRHMNVPEPTLHLHDVPVWDDAALRDWLGPPHVPFELRPHAFTHTISAGGAGITTSLHFSQHLEKPPPFAVDHLYAQCSGRTKVVLWRPCDHAALYPRGEHLPYRPDVEGWRAAAHREDLNALPLTDSPHVSRIGDLDMAAGAPSDRSAWPGFAEAHARRFEIVLEPGDILYIPRWWWHTRTSITAGTALSVWLVFKPEVYVTLQQAADDDQDYGDDDDGEGWDDDEEDEGHDDDDDDDDDDDAPAPLPPSKKRARTD